LFFIGLANRKKLMSFIRLDTISHKALSNQMTYHYWQNNDFFIKIYAQPRAKKSSIVGLHGDRLKIQIKAAPSDNKANEELIDFLADYFDFAKNKIHIVSGQHSRNKLVRFVGMEKNRISLLP
jgi:uncharacterized protein